MNDGSGFDLDGLLNAELHRKVGQLSGPSISVSQSAYHAAFLKGGTMTPLATLAAMASSKAAAGLAVATLAVGGGSAAVAAATGSANPVVWGKTVSAAVATCKSHLASDTHGIGECVSKVAREKGAEERNERSRDKDKDKDKGKGKAKGKDKDKGKHVDAAPAVNPSEHPDEVPSSNPGHPSGTPKSHPKDSPAPRPSDHPTGDATTHHGDEPSPSPSHPGH